MSCQLISINFKYFAYFIYSMGGKTTITISKDTYKKLLKLKSELTAERGENVSWDEFFEEVVKKWQL